MGLRAVSGGGVTNPLPSGYTYPNPTITGTVTANQVTGISTVVAKWGVPVGLASSGTMGNNGAVSGMTALPTTYSGGIWLYYPAGAVAAGVPAAPAFLWTVMTNTTAGTVYNSTWDGAGVPPLGTATAFVTTGPGAFTGVAAGEITAATVTIPAGALGPNGVLRVNWGAAINTAAGNKILRIRYSGGAGTAVLGPTLSTSAVYEGFTVIRNAGLVGAQKATSSMMAGVGVVSGTATQYMAVDTSAATTLVFTLEKATATNHAIWEGADVQLIYGS
jgi:hypothetical protein